jgi:hypothetical protein
MPHVVAPTVQGQPPYGYPTGQGHPPYGYPTGQGQPPYGYPEGQWAPQTPPKQPFYKNAWFLVVAPIATLAIIAFAVNGGETDNTSSAASAIDAATIAPESATPESVAPESAAPESVEQPAEPANPGIGEPAADGDFSFVVSGVDCSLTEIGNSYFGTKAQGQFCVVSVAVTNIGDRPGTFFGDNTTLFNAQGQEFASDTEAAIYLEESASLLEEINPGNTLNSKVVFDVPVGTTPAAIELHDSAFSGGVTVSLQ